MAQFTELKQVIMMRDSLTSEEADDLIDGARAMILEDGMDPEEVLLEEFGLEPDYVFDLVDWM